MGSSVSIVGKPPALSTVLRRYINLPKFLDLLHTRTLYLPRVDQFTDRLEGALFPSLRRLLDGSSGAATPQDNADSFYQRARRGCFVSCWSIGAKDNMALWQLYGDVRTSIAVTTTVEQLLHLASSWSEEVEFQRVQYVEHARHRDWIVGSPRDVLRYKDQSFFYERELRITVSRTINAPSPLGLRLDIPQLSKAIRSVVLGPAATPDYVAAIKDLCAKYELSIPVRQSKLAFVPT